MPFPQLPPPAPAGALLVCACYEDGTPLWGRLIEELDGRREGDVLDLGATGVRLRLAEDAGWTHVQGGNLPALLPAGETAPVAVVADISVVYGGAGPLLVDLAVVPGRCVRVPSDRAAEVLAAVLGGKLGFEDLVADADLYGMYQGDGGRPADPVPAPPSRRSFPALPAEELSLLVRTSFEDDEGWRALLDELGGVDEDGRLNAEIDFDDVDVDEFPLQALVVDDPAFEGLLPGEVPALVPPGETTLVALAGARTFSAPGRPLAAVDLHDVPGNAAVLPGRMVGSMVCNLDLANMDFTDFVTPEGVDPWWGE
ncbi:DUF6924 domain-containing protein [Streptomyces fuscigenes]|uniref:DUF6924 domain-containing protein n=1 Tax=Streptomyces fuscigenes TaxID=1528880 RepID=UPI001F2BDBCD|nr:hypothetical protein [Streptomyces fuscigenes]MCF3964599.1 hypothetical protein [Streptomyces fuscigenes]